MPRHALGLRVAQNNCDDGNSRTFTMCETQRVPCALPIPARSHHKHWRNIIRSTSRGRLFWLRVEEVNTARFSRIISATVTTWRETIECLIGYEWQGGTLSGINLKKKNCCHAPLSVEADLETLVEYRQSLSACKLLFKKGKRSLELRFNLRINIRLPIQTHIQTRRLEPSGWSHSFLHR